MGQLHEEFNKRFGFFSEVSWFFAGKYNLRSCLMTQLFDDRVRRDEMSSIRSSSMLFA